MAPDMFKGVDKALYFIVAVFIAIGFGVGRCAPKCGVHVTIDQKEAP